MAEKSRPDPASGSAVNADEYEVMGRYFAADGVFGTPADTAVVYADSTGRQVKVRAGKMAMVGGYQWFSDPNTDIVMNNGGAGLPANTSGNPRIDMLVLRLDRSTRTVRLTYLQGTPAASPSPPTTKTDAGYSSGQWDFPLAQWTVASGYTTIAAGDIVIQCWYPQPSGMILCNSTSRPWPSRRYPGMRMYEYDTGRVWTWDGNYLVPEIGQSVFAGWKAQNVTNLDNGVRTVWTYNWTPTCTGTFRIHARTPIDGVLGEEAKLGLQVNGSDIAYRVVKFAGNSYVDEVFHEGFLWCNTTSTATITVWSTRTYGGSFFNSRSANRWLEISYMAPGNLVQNA